MRRFIALLVLFSSCTRYMTKDVFELVTVGSNIHLVEDQYGEAYDIQECQQGIKQYRYIERIATSPTTTDYCYYIFLVGPDGRIIQKRTESVGSVVDFRTP